MSLTIYHNPRCSKSRQALELLKSKGLEPKVIEYLKTPPTVAELDAILKALDLEPQDIARSREEVYQKLGLAQKTLSRKEWLETLVKNPILIERPIVVHGNKAALGRPPEKVLAVL
jgi:arsenate reductase